MNNLIVKDVPGTQEVVDICGVMESGTQTGQNSVKVVFTQFELTKGLYTSGLFSKIELTPSAKLFLWALCTHYNPKNKTMFPSQANIAKKLGISEKSAERAVKELKSVNLIEYETKRVNHYRFSEKFFSVLNLSGVMRQNVGSDVRQNVGLTNKKEQIKNNGKFYKTRYGQHLQSGGKAVPSVEETQKFLEEREKERADVFNPLDYSHDDAYNWIKTLPEFWLKRSKIARVLIEKYQFEEFLYTLEFDIKPFKDS